MTPGGDGLLDFAGKSVSESDNFVHDTFVDVRDGVEERWAIVQVLGEASSEPVMVTKLRDGDAEDRINDENLVDEIGGFGRDVIGDCELSAFDFGEESGNIVLVEGKASAEESVEDDTAGPHVDFRAGVESAGDDLGSRVVWRAT